MLNSDIDIDVYDRNKALDVLKGWTNASMMKDGKLEYHKTGVYFQNIPHSQATNIASINYKEAEEKGYFKIDFLNNSVYKNVLDERHLQELSEKEPDWSKLENEIFVKELFQLNNSVDLVLEKKPKSIEQLAMLIALIRPGKRYLKSLSWNEIEKKIWDKEENEEYHFKKSHAFAYAMAIIIQMNLR